MSTIFSLDRSLSTTPKSHSYLQFQIEQKDEYIKMLENQLFNLKEAYAELEGRKASADGSSDTTSTMAGTSVQQSVNEHSSELQVVRDPVSKLKGRICSLIDGRDYGAALWDELCPPFKDMRCEVNALTRACKLRQEDAHSAPAGENQRELECLYEAQIDRLKEDHDNEKAQIRKDHEAEYQAMVEEHQKDITRLHNIYKDATFIGETLQLAMLKLDEHQYGSESFRWNLLNTLQTLSLNSMVSNIDKGDGTPHQDQCNSCRANGESRELVRAGNISAIKQTT